VSRALVPIVAGLLGLTGSLGATLFLHRSAASALDRVLEERLRSAGDTAIELLGHREPSAEELRGIMRANGLEGAYLLSSPLEVRADATGPSGVRADLLRVDRRRSTEAFQGRGSVSFSYTVDGVPIATAYFPLRGGDGTIRGVLALEAGHEFAHARTALRRALWVGVALSALGALTLAVVAQRWSRAEAHRRRAGERAARGDALARMGAMVAHEIRNPLGVIRGGVELVRARSGDVLPADDREALADVLGEVDRLSGLTQDFLDLAREPALAVVPVDVAEIASDAARALSTAHPEVAVAVRSPPLRVHADPARLRQVFANLLLNAAQAGARSVEVLGESSAGAASVEVRDDGPGVDPALRGRLFDPFATTRRDGTGLGLAISRRIVERHGGELRLLNGARGGAAFLVRLPLAPG
jgi:two-component system, OmpR family, sensor kinase